MTNNEEKLIYLLERVIGDHNPPRDCYSTGLLHGDLRDFACPSCEALRAVARIKSETLFNEKLVIKCYANWRNDIDGCEWPLCGCDEKATIAVDSLKESGHFIDIKEREELERDAERYRWLREQHWSDSGMFVVEGKDVVRLGAHCPSKERLDDTIDCAMRKEKE